MLKLHYVIVEPNSMGRLRWANDMETAISLYPEEVDIRTTRINTHKFQRISVEALGRRWSLWLRRPKIVAKKDELMHILAPLPFVPKSDYILGLDDLLPYKQLYIYQKDRASSVEHANNLQIILKAPKMQVLAQYVKQELVTMFGKKKEDVFVVPAPVDMQKFKIQDVRRDGDTILWVGDDHPRKNLPRLIEAIATMNPSISLVWPGKVIHREEREKVRNLAKRLGVNLREVGYVSDERLVELYNTSSLLVYPCIDDGGFGLPQVEAAACGLPSALSDIPPFRDVLGDDLPIWFDPLDVESIADGLDRGLSMSPDRQALRESVLRYDFPIIGRKMIDVYREIADGKAG